MDEGNRIWSFLILVFLVYEVYKTIKGEISEEKALEVYAQLQRAKVIHIDVDLAIEAADFSLMMLNL